MTRETRLDLAEMGVVVAGFLGPVLMMGWILRQLASPVRLKPEVLGSEIKAALITVLCLVVVKWIGLYIMKVLRK
jgi:hypothetical protein